MSALCDIYICEAVNVPALRFVQIFDCEFQYDVQKEYFGYLGVNIGRIKAVSIIVDLKKHGVKAFSVPVRYRDGSNLSIEEALQLASRYAADNGCSVVFDSSRANTTSPAFWLFVISEDPKVRSGGVVLVDRLDGHIWQAEEYDEYMYDFNNVF